MYKHLHALWLFKHFFIEDLLDVDLRAYFLNNEMRIGYINYLL
jgi:hypothetical protein